MKIFGDARYNNINILASPKVDPDDYLTIVLKFNASAVFLRVKKMNKDDTNDNNDTVD